jgi:hypothetical protein
MAVRAAGACSRVSPPKPMLATERGATNSDARNRTRRDQPGPMTARPRTRA